MVDLNPKELAISVLLLDGDPNGVKKISTPYSSMEAYIIPRNKLNNAISENNLGTVGLYFLFGEQVDNVKPSVYVGQTDSSGRRLKEQRAKYSFWDTVIVFTSDKNKFNLTHADYLEAYCYDKLTEIDRYIVENAVRPNILDITREDRATITQFYVFIKTILSTLGYPVFEEPISINNEVLTCEGKSKGVRAEGTFVPNGFLVYAGSQAVLNENVSQESIHKERSHLINEILIPDRGCYIFKNDYTFKNHTVASRVILGYSAIGDEKWKYNDGKTIKEKNMEDI